MSSNMTILPVDLLRSRLATAEQDQAAVRKHLSDAEAKVNDLKAQLALAEVQRATLQLDLQESSLLVENARKRLEDATTPKVNYWGVSDNHSQFSCGSWALEATDTSTYSVCVTPSKDVAANAVKSTKLHNGEDVLVSKQRLQGVENIKVGDILYMGDKKRKALFKGVVVGQQVKGLFKSNDPSLDSLRRRVEERCNKMNKTIASSITPLDGEIEILWNVKWECVSKLNKEIKEKIHFSDRSRTIRPLDSPLI